MLLIKSDNEYIKLLVYILDKEYIPNYVNKDERY